MRTRRFLIVATTALMIALLHSSGALQAQSAAPVALGGVVSSEAEGKMEGVLVTARREGAIFTVTVVSDAQGRYGFPRTHLDAGKYAIAIRAVGYDLASPGSVDVTPGAAASLDLKLQKTKDISRQLTSGEWMLNMPGSPEDKSKVLSISLACNYCHSLQRIVRSKHTAEDFVPALRRMKGYYPDGTAASDDGRGRAKKATTFGDSTGRPTPPPATPGALPRQFNTESPNWAGKVTLFEIGEYFSSVNLSGGKTTWAYDLKTTLPRPKGKATRVIITQWDQPRRDTVSHDGDIDSKGNYWYGDESAQFVGKVDPKTNTITEFPMPALPEGHLPGTRDVQVDADDNVWFPMRVPGGASLLTKFDVKTQKVTPIEGAFAQFLALGPNGKIWTGGAGNPFVRIDMKTMKIEGSYPGSGYQIVVNSKGNPYIGDEAVIKGFDVSVSKELSYPVPSSNPVPVPSPSPKARRGRMDSQDRFWFAEFNADKIGMFDTRTETFKEFPLRQYSRPYTASVPDKNGYIYSPSGMSDRLMRLDPKTGEVVEFLMPTELDTKKIAIDPSTSRVTLWMANTRAARIVRAEMLD